MGIKAFKKYAAKHGITPWAAEIILTRNHRVAGQNTQDVNTSEPVLGAQAKETRDERS